MSLNALPCLPRGKCNVTLLNETDVLASYLDKEVRHHCSVIGTHYFTPIYSLF